MSIDIAHLNGIRLIYSYDFVVKIISDQPDTDDI